jgi:hypothetical protein
MNTSTASATSHAAQSAADFGARSVVCGAREVHAVGSISSSGWAIGSMEEWRCSMKSRRA